MPFKSQKQRGWMYENKPKMAKEFEEATPEDMKLPKKAKKMADGGEVEEEHKTQLGEDATLVGLRDLMRKHAAGENIHETPDFTINSSTKNYAGGGEVHALPDIGSGGYKGAGTDNAQALMSLIQSGGTSPFLPGGSIANGLADASAGAVGAPEEPQPIDPTDIPPPSPDMPSPHYMIDPQGINPPSAPLGAQHGPTSLSDTASSLSKTPDTNYDFYGDVGADKRKALYDQLLNQQRSPGNLVAQGLGGIGSAIANSFGGQHTDYQGAVRNIGEKNTANRIGAFDTQREQKLQDMQGKVMGMRNDPNSPLNTSARQMAEQALGKKIPSGMTVDVLEKLVPGIGEMAMKQLGIAEMAQYHKGELGQQKAALGQKEDIYKSEHPILNFLNPVGEGSPTSPVSNPNATPGHGVPDLGSTFNGGKVLKVTRIK